MSFPPQNGPQHTPPHQQMPPMQQPYPPQPGYPAQPYAPQTPPAPIVINNVASSSSVAMAGGFRRYRRQSVMVHIVLFCFTAGIGNILYAIHISRWNRKYA